MNLAAGIPTNVFKAADVNGDSVIGIAEAIYVLKYLAAAEPHASCGEGKVFDCKLKCVNAQKAQSWIGDGYCDDGRYGVNLLCPYFQNDKGDCQ